MGMMLRRYHEKPGDVAPDEGAAFPGGAPDDTWKVAQLKAWAKAHDCDLGDATKKADIVKAICNPANPKSTTGDETLPVVPADPSVEQTDLEHEPEDGPKTATVSEAPPGVPADPADAARLIEIPGGATVEYIEPVE